jgi:hypothetical protein
MGEIWCPLATVNLDHPHFNNMEGVYIIWHAGPKAATVYVGQGIIRERLASHRIDPRIQAYSNFGLYVTWASVSQAIRSGVEIFLANKLRPIVGENYPNVIPVAVDLPW